MLYTKFRFFIQCCIKKKEGKALIISTFPSSCIYIYSKYGSERYSGSIMSRYSCVWNT